MTTYGPLFELTKNVATLIIGAIVAYIAYQQWRTNRDKFILDRYDRRIRIYLEVQRLCWRIIQDPAIPAEDLAGFRAATAEAYFLFGPQIMRYLEEMHQRGVHLALLNTQYRDATQAIPRGYDHRQVVEGRQQELTWFAEQYDAAKEQFRPYLDLSR